MKKLKFEPYLAKLILDGSKTTTWRLFDDKNLQVGDDLEFLNSESLKTFSKATITELNEKSISELTDIDRQGHEKFESDQAMYNFYKRCYKQNINANTKLKIIKFKLL